jgi:hypothetical protein
MDWFIPIITGTTAMVYIYSFNRIFKMYEKSERTLTINDLFNFNHMILQQHL